MTTHTHPDTPREARKHRAIREPRTRAEWFAAYDACYLGSETIRLSLLRDATGGAWLLDYNVVDPDDDDTYHAFPSEDRAKAWAADIWPDVIWRRVPGSRNWWQGLANLNAYDFDFLDDDDD